MSTPKNPLKEIASNRATVLRNETCFYCGRAFSDVRRTKEHVIGRRFVPKGKLEAEWNLIGNACEPCNNEKGDLEDDISSITLQPDLMGDAGHQDPEVIEAARARATRSISRRTGKPVADSQEQMKLKVPMFPGVEATFSFTAPAQSAESRILRLARFHITAFFYYLSYNNLEKRGFFARGGFHPIAHVNRRDWGNELVQGFAAEVVSWPVNFGVNTAGGFFRCIIRQHPTSECWSWALEWNHNTRVIGFLGDEKAARDILNALPEPVMQRMDGPGSDYVRFRTEIPIADAEADLLFDVRQEVEELNKEP